MTLASNLSVNDDISYKSVCQIMTLAVLWSVKCLTIASSINHNKGKKEDKLTSTPLLKGNIYNFFCFFAKGVLFGGVLSQHIPQSVCC